MTCFLGGAARLWDTFHAAVAAHPGRRRSCADHRHVRRPGPHRVAALPRLEAALRTVHHEVDPNVIDDVAAAATYADRLAEVREPLWRAVLRGARAARGDGTW
jgi:hypothetical protein